MSPNGIVVIELPEPPTLNVMLAYAKQRTRRSRNGGWMRRALPIVYDQKLELYETHCLVALTQQRIIAPPAPWPRWQILETILRVHQLHDWIECQAALKWPVDVLVRQRFVVNDSPRELLPPPVPQQIVDRRNRGVRLTIAEVRDG